MRFGEDFAVLRDRVVRDKLVHGSDWPIIAVPPVMDVGWRETFALMGERNWMRRDVLIKKKLDFDEAYWRRASKILRLPRDVPSAGPLNSRPASPVRA